MKALLEQLAELDRIVKARPFAENQLVGAHKL